MAFDCSGRSEDYFVVIIRYGRFGTAFAETDLDRANYETTFNMDERLNCNMCSFFFFFFFFFF